MVSLSFMQRQLSLVGAITLFISVWPSLAFAGASNVLAHKGEIEQSISIARILAALALGFILVIGVTLLIARQRIAFPATFSDWVASWMRRPDVSQSDLVVILSRPLVQGASAHHVRICGADWLVVVGTGGVCAVKANSPESSDN